MRCATVLALSMLFHCTSPAWAQKIPPALVGVWAVGNPYDLGQPVGVNARQESYVRSLQIGYSPEFVYECGAKFAIESVEVKTWSVDEFRTRYNFSPESIGLKGAQIIEVSISLLSGAKACGKGEYMNPGRKIFIGGKRHIVIVVANDYFPLRKIG
ncbi:MAG TPA: hypothetical protein VG267_06420 [Terracidiphilus sp.]|jgi:hypothetical protein|nr:hypothetical protein [Terracidiphilus sp.]